MSQQEEEEGPNGCCRCLACCLFCCYLCCPPMPNNIVRKLAFHPSKKGVTYTLVYKNQPEKEIRSLKDIQVDEILIRLHKYRKDSNVQSIDLEVAVENVETFVATTSRNNRLVVVKYTPTKNSLDDRIVLFSQPNCSDLGQFLNPEVAVLQRMGEIIGAEVVCYDYSGYGYSTGSPSEKNIYADVGAVYDSIRHRWPEKKIVLVGCSMGTAASVWQAAKCPQALSGLVLIAGFSSGLPIVLKKQPTADTCCLDRFCSVRRITEVEAPVLLIHGENDSMVPIDHAKLMISLAKKPATPLWLEGVGHQNILSHPAVFKRLRSFIEDETTDSST